MRPPPPSRIAILGGAGAGKSTLARRVGAALGLPVVHLDRVVFGPGWIRFPVAEARERLGAMLAPGGWVVEGTYPELADLMLPQADLVIWIDQPAWLRLWRAWRKTRIHRAGSRVDRPDDCAEGFSLAYARDIWSLGGWSTGLGSRLTEAAGRAPLRLRGDAAVARFIQSLEAPQS